MKGHNLLAWLGLVVLVFAVSTSAMADISLHFSFEPAPYSGEVVDIPIGSEGDLWFHIDDGGQGGFYHVSDFSFQWEADPPDGAQLDMVEAYVQPSIEYQASQWYKLIHGRVTSGIPSTSVMMQMALTLPEPIGTVWSNPIYGHITPEPSGMLALGTGILGAGGILLRRRRS